MPSAAPELRAEDARQPRRTSPVSVLEEAREDPNAPSTAPATEDQQASDSPVTEHVDDAPVRQPLDGAADDIDGAAGDLSDTAQDFDGTADEVDGAAGDLDDAADDADGAAAHEHFSAAPVDPHFSVAPARRHFNAAPETADEEDTLDWAPLAGGRPTWRPDPARMGAALVGRTRALASSTGDRLRGLTREQWLWIGVIALAAVLRYWGMGDKPLHHDESMHAYYSLTFALDPSSYAYNPLLHGPFQFHAEGIMFAFLIAMQHLFGVPVGLMGGPWINDTTARIVPCTFGVGIVCLPYGLRRELGRAGALIAAFLLAVSPAFVYFSRFLREDVYFNFFMFAMVVCTMQFLAKRTTGWFVGIFLSFVLAYATFEGIYLITLIFVGFLVLLAAWELASGLARKLPRTLSARERTFFSRALVLLTLATVAGTAALYGLRWVSSLSASIAKADPTGTNPPALADKSRERQRRRAALCEHRHRAGGDHGAGLATRSRYAGHGLRGRARPQVGDRL